MPQSMAARDNIYLETILTFLCYHNFKVHNIATGDVQMNYNICKLNYPFSKHSLFTSVKTPYYTTYKAHRKICNIYFYSIYDSIKLGILFMHITFAVVFSKYIIYIFKKKTYPYMYNVIYNLYFTLYLDMFILILKNY